MVAILVAAAPFTNAAEILGERPNLVQGALGRVLGAVGTALPETMIPMLATLGAPFMPTTLAMFAVGASIVASRWRRA